MSQRENDDWAKKRDHGISVGKPRYGVVHQKIGAQVGQSLTKERVKPNPSKRGKGGGVTSPPKSWKGKRKK